jgi:hypothetical protein
VLGSVSHNEAKILFRNPNFASMVRFGFWVDTGACLETNVFCLAL